MTGNMQSLTPLIFAIFPLFYMSSNDDDYGVSAAICLLDKSYTNIYIIANEDNGALATDRL